MRRSIPVLALFLWVEACSPTAVDPYFPPPGDVWEHRSPAQLGMDSVALAEAVAHAVANEPDSPRDLEAWMRSRSGDDPYGALIGPLKPRGGSNGLIVRHGYIVAEWGDTKRVDVTYSVTKSFLSTTTGLAWGDGLIRDVHDLVGDYVQDGGFDSPHNSQITWHHLLQQTSEWEGELFGKPDIADRRRGRDRELNTPGTFWEYNDVRVNRLALATLRVWQRALPEVLKQRVMDPIGASDTWEWHGYTTSDVEVDGKTVKSVSGGGHWGGGLWISSRDQARFGYLMLRRGEWSGEQLVSEDWVDMLTTPTEIEPTYGYMWWLNTDHGLWDAAPVESYAARGGGSNVIWIDPTNDLVAVVRWINGNAVNGFLERIIAALHANGE